MNKRKSFQVKCDINEKKIFNNNINRKNKKQTGITLIALVISIIVILILAGVSLNATIGDNGIITQAQNATYMQSIAVLEEYFNNYYVEHYEEMSKKDESKVMTLTTMQPNWFYIPANEGIGTLRYIIDSDGNALYLIKKSNLPDEIKNVVKGGEAEKGNYSDYVALSDVYGITSDLKVYYCKNGKDSILGINSDELDNDDPSRIIFKEGTEWSNLISNGKQVTASDIKSIKTISIDSNSKITSLKEIYNLSNLREISLSNVNLQNLDGIQNIAKLRSISLNNVKIEDYSNLENVKSLESMKISNESEGELNKIGIALKNANINNFQKMYIQGNQIKNLNFLLNVNNSIKQSLNELDISSNDLQVEVINGEKIYPLEGIKDFVNISKLIGNNNKNLTTLKGIENLQKLGYIYFANCNLGNEETNVMNENEDSIASLKNKSNLYYMNLEYNINLKWISYIQENKNINNIFLAGCESIYGDDLGKIKSIIMNCNERYTISSKYSLLLLDENTTRLDLKSQTLELENFKTLKTYKKINYLRLDDINFVENGEKVENTETINKIINDTLGEMTEITCLSVRISKLYSIEFVKNLKKLKEIDLANTQVVTGTKDSKGKNNGLELLNDFDSLGMLVLNNSSIDLTKIQKTLNNVYYYDNVNSWLGMQQGGIRLLNADLIRQLENCNELTKLEINRSSNYNGVLDLSKCTNLIKINANSFSINFKFPNSIKNINLAGAAGQGINDYSNVKSVDEIKLWCTFGSQSNIEKIINNIKDLEYIGSLTIDRFYISTIDFLDNLKNVQIDELKIFDDYRLSSGYFNNFTNLDGLRNLTSLKSLTVAYGKVRDITGICNLINLTGLDLSYNQIADLKPLENLILLKSLNLNDNCITDTSAYDGKIYKNLEILKKLNNVGALRILKIKNNVGIIDYTILTNIKNWKEKEGF